MIDPSIPLQVKQYQQPDRLNMMAQVMGIQQAQNQNELATYGLNKARRQDDQSNALMAALQGGLDISTPEGQTKALSIAPEAAQTFIKARLENQNTQAQIGERNASAGLHQADAASKTIALHRDQLANVNNPQVAVQWLQAQYQDPVVGPILSKTMPFEAAVQSIPQDPQGFMQWRQQQALGMTKYLELNKPTTTVVNAGGTSQVLQTPGLGGAPQAVQTVQHTQSPDSVASNARIASEGALNRGQQAQLHADTIKNENLRAGVGPAGALDDNTERTAQAIANGQLPAPTGMALLNPKNQRILGRVMEINPQYDATTVSAKKAAAVAFTSGQQGNALRSVSTANAHLDQLNELVDALGNNNTQVINKVQNYFSKQAGGAGVTNFDAIKNIVGQEVVKAIVAGGGGVGEREEAAKIFSTANSPQQLKGAIQHYRMVMGAQANNLMEQRRAAGLPDSTLPNYPGSTAGGAGGGMPNASAIDAELARRAGGK